MSLVLLEHARSSAARHANEIAIRQIWPVGTTLTHGELWAVINAISVRLRQQFQASQALLLSSPNRPHFIAAFLGILQAGMTVFPVATDLAAPELLDAAARSGAAGLIAVGTQFSNLSQTFSAIEQFDEAGVGAMLAHGPRWKTRNDCGVSMLLLSSGTTGKPKIVRRDADALDAVARNTADAVGFTPADTVLAAVPLCHSYGVEHGLLAPLWAGSTVHLSDGFNLDAAIGQLQHGGISIFPGVPFMFEMLCGIRANVGQLPRLRRAYSAGGPLPDVIADSFQRKFGVRVTQLYGATEIGSVTFNAPDEEPFEAASVGRPMTDVKIAILDPSQPDGNRPLEVGEDGEVAIAAPSMMSGYLDDSAPIQDGHFRTGDLGRLNALGRLTITGRIKLLIDIGGRKVNPLEVEQVIESHPEVGACVIIPMRVSQTLNRLKAIVTPAREGMAMDLEALRELARSRLSSYKVPRVFEVRDSLPRTAAGKIQRHLLEEDGAR